MSTALDGKVVSRRDALLERVREHERLERRARLALALHGEVELALVEVLAADHREHVAGARVDRDERGRRPLRVGQPLVDRLPRAIFWSPRSIVVFTRSPPPKTVEVPYLSISCCFT